MTTSQVATLVVIATAVRAFGFLNVAINNAGIMAEITSSIIVSDKIELQPR